MRPRPQRLARSRAGRFVGDQFFFNGGAALTDLQNPANNFYNGTRSRLNSAVSMVGDLPQLKGTQGSMWGVDLDIVDITSKLSPGQTQAQLTASTTNDGYFLGGFITSISDLRPDFAASLKSAVDVNGGLLVSGDELEYTIAASNAGSDAAIDVVLTDALPVGVTYVPGSLEVATGPNAGAKSDAAGDDQGYDAGTRTIVVRLGMDADAVDGGRLAIDETSSVKFRVTRSSIRSRCRSMSGNLPSWRSTGCSAYLSLWHANSSSMRSQSGQEFRTCP